MYTLYIDTHYKDLVIALIKNGVLIQKKILNSNKHSENTINLIEEIVKSNKIGIEQIKEIIVINGPGSFTGVRIGVVIAKIWSYTKNIKLKAISYLQALALKYDRNINLAITDKNGAFVGKFDNNHNLIQDYFYLSNNELSNYSEVIENNDGEEIDVLLVYNYLKNKESINPHILKPLYVKKIEVQHD